MSAARAVWVAAGTFALLLHLPPPWPMPLAIAVPWIVVMLLLAGKRTATRLLDAWRRATGSNTGAIGLTGIVLIVLAVAAVMSLAAAALLGMWLAAAASLIGLLRGPTSLRDHLAGWALLGVATGCVLLIGEGVLHLDAVAERVGTPAAVGAWARRYDAVLSRNILGIRSPYETLRKEDDVLRVVAIGDSFTWGDKIASSDSTWPARLEHELRRSAAARVEVVNLGQKGFTTVNEAEMLRRLGWQFEPDLVVVQFYLNDILPSGENFRRADGRRLFPEVRLLPQRYRTGPIGRSALLNTAESALAGLRHGDRAARVAKWSVVYQRQGPEWVALADALREMGTAAAERSVPIVLLLFPDFIPGVRQDREIPFAAIHEQVVRAARESGFSTLDLTPFYLRQGHDMRHWWASPYDPHPGPAAADLAGRVLADFVRESALLTRGS